MTQNKHGYRWLGFVLSAGLVFLAAPSATAQQSSWQKEWKKTLAAAQKEGVVVVSGPPGAFQRRAITSGWAKAYPKIKLSYTGARGSKMVAKVVRERTAGLFKWDVILASTSPTVFRLVPLNALAPLRKALIKLDIADDRTWIDSFKAGFMDEGKKFFYNAMGTSQSALGFVNRACVSKKTFNKLADMTKPALKGKIVWGDPTRPGTGSRGTWVMSLFMGQDWLKNLYQKHGVTFSRDYRQMTDWLVSCHKPIAMGMPNDVVEQMQKQGIGTKNRLVQQGATSERRQDIRELVSLAGVSGILRISREGQQPPLGHQAR
jgi:hypothetical protein